MVKVALRGNDWVELPSGARGGLYIDGYHKKNLDTAKTVVKKDWDMVFVYDGYEGTGKSVKMMQDAFYCDPTLTLNRITFNPKDFKEAVKKAKKYQAVCLDEAYGGLSSKGAMSAINKAIVQMLTVIREKNLFIFIVLPTFFDLQKYVALWRSRVLIHVYADDDFNRGYFEFYDKHRKLKLYVSGKKFYSYSGAKPNFRGSFTNTYVVDEQSYRDKKRKTSLMDEDADSVTLSHRKAVASVRSDIYHSLKTKDIGLSVNQISKIMSVTRQTLSKYVREKTGLENFDIDKMENELET